MSNLLDLQEVIDYHFKDSKILVTAFTHQSYANEHNVDSYERLEFLGDAVIELVVSNYIYNHCNFSSGDLTKLRASLVSTTYLQGISEKLSLTSLTLKAKSLPTLSKKNTADLFESLIGAIYVDGGLDSAKKIIEKFVIIDDRNIREILINGTDPKSRVQEYFQSIGKAFEYRLVDSFGLDHEKSFVVVLVVDNVEVSRAVGKSIREGESKCAQIYLESI